MPPALPPQPGSDPATSTTTMPGVDAELSLSPRTVAWLADHPHARRFVRSVWDKLAELERSSQYPGAIAALRRVLIHHQPTSTGRCRTCRPATWWRWRRPAFPCTVWHQIRFDLLGLFAGAAATGSQPDKAAARDRAGAAPHRLPPRWPTGGR